jgi:mRNA interferase RelE/StbE
VYQIRILDAAARELTQLDNPMGRRIAERINWLATNLDNLNPEPLTGDLTGLYKLRVGDYRVLYEILQNEQTILIHQIGHRREIYRRR